MITFIDIHATASCAGRNCGQLWYAEGITIPIPDLSWAKFASIRSDSEGSAAEEKKTGIARSGVVFMAHHRYRYSKHKRSLQRLVSVGRTNHASLRN